MGVPAHAREALAVEMKAPAPASPTTGSLIERGRLELLGTLRGIAAPDFSDIPLPELAFAIDRMAAEKKAAELWPEFCMYMGLRSVAEQGAIQLSLVGDFPISDPKGPARIFGVAHCLIIDGGTASATYNSLLEEQGDKAQEVAVALLLFQAYNRSDLPLALAAAAPEARPH